MTFLNYVSTFEAILRQHVDRSEMDDDEWQEYVETRDHLYRLAALGADVETILPKVAEADEGHTAHLTRRCIGRCGGDDACGDWQWYVWTSLTENEPLMVNICAPTAGEALSIAVNQLPQPIKISGVDTYPHVGYIGCIPTEDRPMPAVTKGSEKQIEWATAIVEAELKVIDKVLASVPVWSDEYTTLSKDNFDATYEPTRKLLNKVRKTLDERLQSAKWIIDNKNNLFYYTVELLKKQDEKFAAKYAEKLLLKVSSDVNNARGGR